MLGSAERLPVARVAQRAGVGRPALWRWRERFVTAGLDGLLRDATREPGKAPQWTGRAMAETTGINLRSAQRIWAAHDLQPHRSRTFKRSNDPAFAAKVAGHRRPLCRPAQARDRALGRREVAD